jgi:hypothetical protein
MRPTLAAVPITLQLFTVRRAAIPAALWRAAVDPRRLRAEPGVRFAKVLGTGDGRTFAPRDANARRWAVLCAGEAVPALERWRRIADEIWQAELGLISSRGRWARREPFGPPTVREWDGPVAAITRARLHPLRARAFRRAVPAVASALREQPGLRFAIGVGEAPIGLQGTFSVWESPAALTAFAYRGAAHAEVVRRTPHAGWYTEELFARFALLNTNGRLGSGG